MAEQNAPALTQIFVKINSSLSGFRGKIRGIIAELQRHIVFLHLVFRRLAFSHLTNMGLFVHITM